MSSRTIIKPVGINDNLQQHGPCPLFKEHGGSFVYDRLLREAYVKSFSFTLIILPEVVALAQVVDCFPLEGFNHVKILVY